MKKTVTLFKSVTDVSTTFNRSVFEALDRIRDGKSREIVEQIRQLPKEKGDEIKRALPGVCFNGSFRYRSLSGLIQHSGLMIIDLDKFESLEQAEEERNIASQDPYTFAAWISPSGKGIKILVQIPPDADNHKGYFESYKEYLNHPNWDDSGSDVPRFCFESYDPDIYINPDSEIWMALSEPDVEDIGTTQPIIQLTSESRIISNLLGYLR